MLRTTCRSRSSPAGRLAAHAVKRPVLALSGRVYRRRRLQVACALQSGDVAGALATLGLSLGKEKSGYCIKTSELRAARLRAQLLSAGVQQTKEIDEAYTLLLDYATEDGKPTTQNGKATSEVSNGSRLLKQALFVVFLLPVLGELLYLSARFVRGAVAVVPACVLLFGFYWFFVRDGDKGRN